jgi:hypothetical protein
VNDGREVSGGDGSTLCRACAFGAAYQPHSLSQKRPGRGAVTRSGQSVAYGHHNPPVV